MLNSMMSQQLQGDPRWARVQQMAQGKSPQELEQVARNLCQQAGIPMEQAIAQFKQMMGSQG